MAEQQLKVMEKPWTHSVQQVLDIYAVNRDSGLTGEEAGRRRKQFGKNALREDSSVSVITILIRQFKSLIMALLAAAAALSFSFSQWVDGTAIIIAMFINAAIGFFMELKAVRSMESLQKLDRVSSRIRRAGEEIEAEAEEIVPGDIVLLASGDLVTADVRIVEASGLQADESALTGESVPVDKHTDTLDEDTPLAERSNMLFKGTSVTRGSGIGVAVSTGMRTELGTVASLVKEAQKGSDPLERQLNVLGKKLIWVVIAIAAVAGGSGLIVGKEFLLMVETTVALIVAAVPEGLLVVATVALARGMQRMAKENALMRRLSAVQTLGSTNVVFTDKTGTLTENRMTVRVIETAVGRFYLKGSDNGSHGTDEGFWDEKGVIDLYEKPALRALIEAALLCNNARLPEKEEEREKLNKDPDYLGDPLEVALLEAGEKVNIRRGDVLAKNPLAREIAFDPEKKLMATYHRTEESYLVAVKGAPAAVFEICSRIRTPDGDKKLTVEGKKQWVRRNEDMARKGLRVLGFAVKEVESIEEAPYENTTFLGLVGILDLPRRDVRPSIEACREAGVRVVMATGDQEHTAVTIGRELGLIAEGESGVVHGKDIADPRLLNERGRKKIMDAKIIVRASPKQKLDLISVHQHEGSIVAMTGDGVNDAPALKKADIGVAMGRRGEQVAREAADMILTDDSFSTIVVAIRFGRVIFENIRKFVVYLISGNLGEIMIVTAASLCGLPLPLLPLQILYLNAINDAFPALALGMGEGESRVMARPPRERREPILTRKHWFFIIGYGALIGASVFGAFLLMLKTQGRGQAVPVAFLTLAFARLWHVFNMRANDARTFRNEITSNRFVWGALALSSVLIAVAVLAPGLSNVLGLHVPGITGWLVVGGFSILPLIFGQAAKFMTRWAAKG